MTCTSHSPLGYHRPMILLLLLLPAALAPTTPVLAQPAAAQSSDQAVRQYRAAVAFQNRQIYDLAAQEWEQFLKNYAEDPLSPKAQHYLGVCYFQLEKYPEAEAAFQRVTAGDGKLELLNETYLNLGLAQFNLGQQGKAEPLARAAESFQTLLTKFPDSKEAPAAWYYRAESLYGLDKKAEAITAYSQLLEKFPQHALRAKALYGLGVAQQESGQTGPAGTTYALFLKEFPEDELATEVGMRGGETLLKAGKFAEAEKRFAAAAAVKGFPFADYAQLRQAGCRYELSQYAPAGQLYAELIQKFPKSPYVPTATMAAGKCYYLADNQGEARVWLSKAQQLGGESAIEAAHWLARSLLKQGGAAEAIKAVEAALAAAAKSPLLPDLMMDRADAVYELQGRRKEAVGLYAQIAKEHAKHRVGPQAAYMAAYAALDVGQSALALDQALAFLKSYPKDGLTADVLYVAAESNLQLRKYPEAEALYTQLLAEHPKRPEVQGWQVRRGLCLYLQKKYADVISNLGSKLAELKAPDAVAEARYLVGSSHFESGQYPQAIDSLKASLAAAPQWRQADETLLVLARAQHRAGQLEPAIADVTKLITQFPKSGLADRAHYHLGEFKYAAGDFAAAAVAYQKVLDTWPQSSIVPHALFGLGWSQLSRQEYAPAAATMTRLVDEHADHALVATARYARAVARQQLKQYAEAIEDVEAFLKSQPSGTEKSDALYVRGLCETGLKKPAAAAETFQTILKEDPKFAARDKVLYELAWSHLAQDQQQAAAEVFGRLAQEHADSPLAGESLYRVAEFQYQNKQYPAASQSYYEAVKKAGKSELGEKAAHKLSWSFYQQKDYEKAYQAFQYQIKTYPEGSLEGDALAMAGECLFHQKKYAETLATLTKALEKKPTGEQFEVIALLHAGQAAGQLEQWEQSLELLERCTTKFPSSDYYDEARYEQGWAKQNLGKLAEAQEIYLAVADKSETETGARARFMAGEIMFLNKKYDEAIRTFFKVAYGYGDRSAPESYHTWQASAMFEAARCLEMLKKIDAAKRLYKELVERFPASDKAPDAKEKLTSLGG